MKRLILMGLLLLFSNRVLGFSTSAETEPMVKEANRWKAGDSIPAKLLEIRDATKDGSHIGLLTDTAPVFASITNYPLLLAIAFRSDVDERIFDCAVVQAMNVAGPNQFFKDLAAQYDKRPELLNIARHKRLHGGLKKVHVVVDGLFIDREDMEEVAAKGIFNEIKEELETGRTWTDVYKAYSGKYEYPHVENFSDGTSIKITKTKIGNYGDFIISSEKHDALPFRFSEVPQEHVASLINRKKGAVIVLEDKKEQRLILYQIREAYRP